MRVRYDTVVIGGGASGLAAALAAARSGRRVCILELDVACGLKILATGNGRCNLSNISLDSERYLHPNFAEAVMGNEPEAELRAFFDSVGILTTREDDRLYPYSLRAESVRDALLGAISRAGVDIVCGAKVTSVSKRTDDTWRLDLSCPQGPLKSKQKHGRKPDIRSLRRALQGAPLTEKQVNADRIVIATGGNSTDIARLFNLSLTPIQPVLCPIRAQIKNDDNALERLNGLRVQAQASLWRDDHVVWSESGEILFRPFGISGVAVFNLSRRALQGDTIALDLFPEYDEPSLRELLLSRSHALGACDFLDSSWFNGLLAPALAKTVAATLGPTSADLQKADPKSNDTLVAHLKNFELEVLGLADDQGAQVTRGGIAIDQVAAPTLSCTDPALKGISVCGEALDIDADCGGFNLAWAWLSGLRAGSNV